MRYPILLCLLAILLACCKNNTGNGNTSDTARIVTSNRQSVDTTPDPGNELADCYSAFFSNRRTVDSNNIIVIADEPGERRLPRFIEEQGLEREYTNIALKDLDKDSTEELWIRNFTMGAHCCDEWYVIAVIKSIVDVMTDEQ